MKDDIQISACLVENNLNFGVLPKSWSKAYAALHRHGQQLWLITLTDLFGHYLTVSLLTLREKGCRYILHIQIAVIVTILYFIFWFLFPYRPIFLMQMRVMRVCFLPSSRPAQALLNPLISLTWIWSQDEGSEILNLWKCCINKAVKENLAQVKPGWIWLLCIFADV